MNLKCVGCKSTKEEAREQADRLKAKGYRTKVTHRPAYQEPIWNVWVDEETKAWSEEDD